MLVKLRRKMILTTMSLVTAALAVMVGAILFMQYQQFYDDVIRAVEHEASEADFGRHGLGQLDAAAAAAEDDDNTSLNAPELAADPASADAAGDPAAVNRMQRGADAPRIHGNETKMVATSTFVLTSDGTVAEERKNALELDEQTRDAAVGAVLAATDASVTTTQSGHLAELDLYYAIAPAPAGTQVAFASGSYISSNMENLQRVLGLVSVGAWLVFLVLSILLARWMVRPTQRAWEQQQQFVADASHELKTPLAVIMANNSILLSHKDQTVESQQRWVESNQAEARQMLDLVNDMLFLARPENAPDQARVASDVDLSALVQASSLQFEALCFERGIELSDNIDPGIVVRGDEQRLQRLVGTLIDNACKYGDSRVKVELSRSGKQAQLRVNNDGAVIAAEDLPHVFERFYRADKARVRSEGGVGLGLAIAREVAREHSGDIRVESSESTGTTFTVTLPLSA